MLYLSKVATVFITPLGLCIGLAGIAVAARAAGRGFPTPDGYIAAIAAAHGFSVATRDVAPFQAAGLKVVNPWHGG